MLQVNTFNNLEELHILKNLKNYCVTLLEYPLVTNGFELMSEISWAFQLWVNVFIYEIILKAYSQSKGVNYF